MRSRKRGKERTIDNWTLKQLIYGDLKRFAKPTIANLITSYFRSSIFRYQLWFRILQKCKRKAVFKYSIGLYAYLHYLHLTKLTGIHANSNIYIGPGLMIVHGGGVFLNCRSIGRNFTVYQNVTLGTETYDSGHIPIVGDDVTIYTGSVVVGDIKVGDGAVIAANSFVNKNVAEKSTVVGAPARVIEKNGTGRSEN